MYQQDLQFAPGHCQVPGGPGLGLGPGPSPGAVLGDFFPDTDRTQPRSHVIKATPRSRPRSGRRADTDARYGWCPVPYQPQGRPSTGGNPQPMMMPPRGPVNQHLVRQRPVDVSSNTMMTWQDRPGPPPPPPPARPPPPYPSAERPYEYSQPPPNMSGGETYPHGHVMPPTQQQQLPPPPPPQYQNMPPMQQQGPATGYEYHGSAECAWRQMPMCHSAQRPPFAGPHQYATPPQQTRQYYHNPAPRPPTMQYVPQYPPQQQEAAPGTWAPPPPPPAQARPQRYVAGQPQQPQPQVMTLPPMTTPPPGHYYIMERPPSQPLIPMYDASDKDTNNYYNAAAAAQRNNMHTPNQQPRCYGQQPTRYSQALVQSGKPRGQHPSSHQKAYNQLMHQDMGHMTQSHPTPGKQYAPFNAGADTQVVTNETSGSVQQYPYYYRYSETVKTSQPLSEHCDMNAGGQHLNNHPCGDHSMPVVSHQTKSTIISSKSVSEVQMLVGLSGGNVANDYRLPAHVDRPIPETPSSTCSAHVDTSKLTIRSGNKQQTPSSIKHGNSQTKKQSGRNETCSHGKAKVAKRSGIRMAEARGGQPSTRGSCKRRLSDSSEVSTLADRDRGYPQSSEQQVTECDAKPVPKLDLGKLDLYEDESDFEEMQDAHFKCRLKNASTPMAVASNGSCAFLEAISKESKNRAAAAAKLLESKSKEDAKYDPFNPGSAASFEYSIDAERLVARLCYSSPETSPPSSAQRHLVRDATGQEHNCLLQENNSVATVYSAHERGGDNEHVTAEGYSNDLALLDMNTMMAGECEAHGNSARNAVIGDTNVARNDASDCVESGNEATWKEGIVLISKGLTLLKSCKMKDTELNKRFELMLYDLERMSRSGIVPEIHNSYLEMSSQQRQYTSRLSYVDQLYEYKSKIMSSEETTDLFEIFPPVGADLANGRDYLEDEMNDDSQLLDSTFTLSTGSKTVLNTPVQSQEINWSQFEEGGCQDEVNTSLGCGQEGVASNIDGSKWVGSERFPFSEQTFNLAKQMTDQSSARRDFPPNSPYESYSLIKDGSMAGRGPWSGKPWDSYPNVTTAEEMYQQSMFYQQNHFEQLLQGQVGFGSGHQNELAGLLCGGKDGESSSTFPANASNALKDTLSFAQQRQLSNCEQDIHYLQSAASKVAPVRASKKGAGLCTSASSRLRRGTTPCGNDADDGLATLSTPTTCAPIDTESDDNASYYMKPGNYLVPKKPMSARIRTEKKVITRNKRKAFSAPAKTSIFIPYPLDPVVPPLPQLPQNPASLFGASDLSLPPESGRLTVSSVSLSLINDPEHFSPSCHQTFSPISKTSKEIKKTNSPVMSNSKERKKKETSRAQYPKTAPKEVRQFQILKRVSKVVGKVDSPKGNSESLAQITGLNGGNQSKLGNSQINGSESSLKSNEMGDTEQGDNSTDVDQTVSSLHSLSINEGVTQQRGRKNAAMKSILNLKVKSKVADKVTTLNKEEQMTGQALANLESGETCKNECQNLDIPTAFQSLPQDGNDQNLGRPSSSQLSTVEDKKSSFTASDDSKINNLSNVSQQDETKVLGTESASSQRLGDTEQYSTSGKNRAEPSSTTSLVITPGSSRYQHRSGSVASSKGVYGVLKMHTSAPNISLDRGAKGGKLPSALAPAAEAQQPRKESPLSRQYAECRDKLMAQKGGGAAIKATNAAAGSDDSSSTTSINSRHRRGPTPVALGKFEKILRNVWSMPEAQFVKHNVSSNQLQEYYQIVKYPIFLENIESKLKNRYYMTIEDIVHDFRQVLFNSRLYFKDSPPVLKKTESLENRLNELLNEYFSGWDFRQITGDPAERLRNRR